MPSSLRRRKLTSIDECRLGFEKFIRVHKPTFQAARRDLPTISKFNVEKAGKRTLFTERAQANWWQLPKNIWNSVLDSSEGTKLQEFVSTTAPFSKSLGLSMRVLFGGFGFTDSSLAAATIVKRITSSYLFATGIGRWRPGVFDRVWRDCVDFFDPSVRQRQYTFYAPIWGLVAGVRNVNLGKGLAIKRLPSTKQAQLATLDNRLAGVSIHDRRFWPAFFFVKKYQAEKYIGPERTGWDAIPHQEEFVSWLNHEVVLIRCFLSHELVVPKFATICDRFPFLGAGGILNELPWRLRRVFHGKQLSRKAIEAYVRRRNKFAQLNNRPGWASVSASMRRFAIAWENPFPADALADVVAALEALLVRDKQEVSYKLRVRAAHFLARSGEGRRTIAKDIKNGYEYRSRVAHGDFVFDDPREWETAKALKRAKGKGGNPFYDVNEVHRLTFKLSEYYLSALEKMIRAGKLELNWGALGL